MTTSDITGGRPFDAVLCDLDGVIRYYDTEAVARLERAAGLEVGTTARFAFAPEQDLPLLLGQITRDQWADSIARCLMDLHVSETVAHELSTTFAHAPSWADEAVVEILGQVRAHVPVVLVTNATTWLEEDLATLGLSDIADHIVSSARVGVAKPDRRIYEIASERAGVGAARCLFVDDREENVQAATTLGMTGVYYRTPADLREALGPLLSR
ncbi:HAD-IA family hydrolase [Streptomyces sp. NPDC050095]|uniref:HAD-IA family hydrolase n=1 Tax=unclassified Streptomyces TaxID=2593676 RepID=UPI003447157F